MVESRKATECNIIYVMNKTHSEVRGILFYRLCIVSVWTENEEHTLCVLDTLCEMWERDREFCHYVKVESRVS